MMTEMLDLSGKNILNTAMIKMFHEQLQTHLKYMKKKKGDLSKEIEDIKKNIMEILELKNIMIEVKNWIV